MSDEPKLTKRQELGLCDLLRQERIGRPYRWMPATMNELRALGYAMACADIRSTSFRLTDAGRARARALVEDLP
jgi:hypothetical protein